MTVMDEYMESGVDDDVFPCKGCGEILEEGKAFELAGHRWHLDCFRCNTCNTLLDSDANLLLLGDGSLICNDCTYSCTACGNKIEDLAILTGDQAFCATCFRCRNCKRKIENLRYARTSQGIFCMSCHESLMARRRKKTKVAAQKARDKDGSPMITDKSLPALPPNAIPPNAFSNDRVDPESDTPTELSPRPRVAYQMSDVAPLGPSTTSRSPERTSDSTKESGALAPPPSNYRKNRNSAIISGDLNTRDDEGYFIPVALDPGSPSNMTPGSASETNRKSKEKDYFTMSKPNASSDKKVDSQASTPHIAFQEKGRRSSFEHENSQLERPSRRLSKRQVNGQLRSFAGQNGDDRKAATGKNQGTSEDFKLQEAPRGKKSTHLRRDSGSASSHETNGLQRTSDTIAESPRSSGLPASVASTRSSQDSRTRDEEDVRLSSEQGTLGRSDARPMSRREAHSARNVNGKSALAAASRSSTSDEAGHLAPARRPFPNSKLSDTYLQPRAPPQPPPTGPAARDSASASTEPPSPKVSPKLPQWSATGDFSMDEDMARILGTDEGSSSILRRVSHAVRHGRTNSTDSSANNRLGHSRSVSETTRGTVSPHWPKGVIAENPTHRGNNISSPISPPGAGQGDTEFLKRQLKSSEQRVAELERQFVTEKDLKNLNKKLIEKRKTVSVLDSQTEIMIRQLEVLAGFVERAKKTNEVLDPRDLEDSAIKEFLQKLERVKHSVAAQIEQLHSERDDLIDEKNQAIADRDRAALEFEQLSSKNAQLADMNNDLTHQIQERFKSQAHTNDFRSPNGLGIYGHAKGASTASVHLDATSSGLTMVGTDAEEPILEGPTVINIRKGQVRKFNWKKGTKQVAHNFSKGIGRAAVAFQQDQTRNHGAQGLTGDNIGLPYNMTTITHTESPAAGVPVTGPNRPAADSKGFGFFKKSTMPKSTSAANCVPAAAEAASTLFGSDLVERADFERRQVPNVVQQCIEEVEIRGMDVEGIYRKTGGNSQVKMIQEAFEKNQNAEISDPGVDITAVTSVLKQYFRKLPNPLITFDVYERILDSNNIQNDMDRCSHLRNTINSLPLKHRDCLEFLMFHLARVAGRERENLMSPKNLAVVFAPTIMRDHSLEKEMTDMHAKNIAVQFIIENSQYIFSEA